MIKMKVKQQRYVLEPDSLFINDLSDLDEFDNSFWILEE